MPAGQKLPLERSVGAFGRAALASVYSEDRVRRITEALALGNSRRAAAAAGGIAPRTFQYWMQRYEDFAQQVAEAESEAERKHMATIVKASQKGNWKASAWWLERMYPEDFGRVDRVELTLRREKADEIAKQLEAEGITISPEEVLEEYRGFVQRALPEGRR